MINFPGFFMSKIISKNLPQSFLFFSTQNVNNGELVPSARSNCTTLPKQEYRLAGWLYGRQLHFANDANHFSGEMNHPSGWLIHSIFDYFA